MPTAKQQAQDIAKKVAKQIAQEPVEILKNAGKQVIGIPEVAQNNEPQRPVSEAPASPQDMKAHAEKTKHKDTRLLQALDQEIEEIRIKEKQEEEQVKVVEEQQKQQASAQQNEALPVISSKRSRRFGMGKGQKAAAEREQVKTERRMPPSG